jgi:hypothetical protein
LVSWESIQLLAEADFFIGVEYSEFFKGCMVESKVARDYGISTTFVNIRELMPDAIEVENNYFASKVSLSEPPKR